MKLTDVMEHLRWTFCPIIFKKEDSKRITQCLHEDVLHLVLRARLKKEKAGTMGRLYFQIYWNREYEIIVLQNGSNAEQDYTDPIGYATRVIFVSVEGFFE